MVGLFAPAIRIMAGIGLALNFAGAVVTVVRTRAYSHIPFPCRTRRRWFGSLALVPA